MTDCVFGAQSNRLLKIENLESLVMLEQLYLSDNGIEALEGLDTLVSEWLTDETVQGSDMLVCG